jgi:hypothetical protein
MSTAVRWIYGMRIFKIDIDMNNRNGNVKDYFILLYYKMVFS